MKKPNIKIIIPARAGSKGVYNKNIRPFNNTSLLEITIDFSCKLSIQNIIVTTDSAEYIENVKCFKSYKKYTDRIALHSRSSWAASDDATDIDVLRDVISAGLIDNSDIVAWLRPTSPLRSIIEFGKAIEKLSRIGDGCAMLRSVKKASTHPYWMKMSLNENMLVEPFIKGKDENSFPNRQSLPDCYEISGEFDFINVNQAMLQNTFFPKPMYAFETREMPKIDIDTEADFKLAEALHDNIGV